MFEARIYRAALAPFVVAVLIGAFSLTDRPRALTSTLAPDAFDGAAATQTLGQLASAFPDRRPGSAGDNALADAIRGELQAPNFRVTERHLSGQTADGDRDLRTVVATRAGTSPRTIVLLAHRDALTRGSLAELSATAALLELGHILAGRVTAHTVALVSTSGGAGGVGAADFAAHAGPVDAVIVIGDLAGTRARHPQVVGWSDGFGGAPEALVRTASDAVARQTGHSAGGPGALEQFARLALPVTTSEQGPLAARGIPAILIGPSGERGPAASDPVDSGAFQGFGRAVLETFNALDAARTPGSGNARGVVIGRLIFPDWAVRLVVGLLLLPALATAIDGLARARRRGHDFGRAVGYVLSWSFPFALAAGFVVVAGRAGVLGPTPAGPVAAPALPVDARAIAGMAAAALVFLLGWLARPLVARAFAASGRPGEDAPAALVLTTTVTAVVVWIFNPFAAALIVLAPQLWLLASAVAGRNRVAVAVLWLLSLLPVALVLYAEARGLGVDVPAGLRLGMALLAGGHVGVFAALLWSICLGCATAMLPVTFGGAPAPAPAGSVTVRGPLSYAGPGSLGGTESALRR